MELDIKIFDATSPEEKAEVEENNVDDEIDTDIKTLTLPKYQSSHKKVSIQLIKNHIL